MIKLSRADALASLEICAADQYKADFGNILKLQYKKLALKWHPDKNGGCQEATRRFTRLTAAFDLLTGSSRCFPQDGANCAPRTGADITSQQAPLATQENFEREVRKRQLQLKAEAKARQEARILEAQQLREAALVKPADRRVDVPHSQTFHREAALEKEFQNRVPASLSKSSDRQAGLQKQSHQKGTLQPNQVLPGGTMSPNTLKQREAGAEKQLQESNLPCNQFQRQQSKVESKESSSYTHSRQPPACEGSDAINGGKQAWCSQKIASTTRVQPRCSATSPSSLNSMDLLEEMHTTEDDLHVLHDNQPAACKGCGVMLEMECGVFRPRQMYESECVVYCTINCARADGIEQ
ncbi:hypothetical protein CYMTET_18743 [Cymbomonas tetramitiformis]|uniref:J domain-containing protein n=1 Tax=Cymbomonas tetramitiformis TaxID=36881 RepID=A0AAE0G831_9CHLO|nr:hypothetical protein CYMTET_18743 [Cymbomonas tetramitiformis]